VECDFPNPIVEKDRVANWTPGHDIGVFFSVGDSLTLVGTAAGHSGLYSLLQSLADEWQERGWGYDDAEWFFAEYSS